jgi:peptidyl-prolyl cis-trans isomerase SurA
MFLERVGQIHLAKKHEEKILNKKLTAIFFFFITFLLISPLIFAYQDLDRIIAVVESSPITYTELEDGVNKAKLFFKKNNIPEPDQTVVEKKVLDELIEKKLIILYAKDYGIKVDQKETDSVVENILKQNQISQKEFEEDLIKQGSNYFKFIEDLKYEILLNKVKTKAISSNIRISDHEIEAHQKKLEKITPDIFYISHILIKFPSDPSPEKIIETEERANKIYKKLAGKSFSEIAFENSDSDDAKNGGNLGPRKKEDLPEIFLDKINNLKPGDYTKPFKSPNGFHILKLDQLDSLKDSTKNKTLSTKYHLKQIVLKPNELKSEADIKKDLLKLKDKIIDGQDISQLAKKYSEDNSSINGGDIGWIEKGLNQKFDEEITKLKINDVSDPIQTDIGWHIIQLVDIKEEESNAANISNKIKMDLINERTAYLFEDWIEQLKSQSFIEIRAND